MKITLEMIKLCYCYGKLYYNNEVTLEKAKSEIHCQTNMNISSCQIYVYNLKQMLEGKLFKRYMSILSYEYYLNTIKKEFSEKIFYNALNSFHKHIEYKEKINKCEAKKDRNLFLSFINK